MGLMGKSGIPPGMASMLKMLGVDPAEIMASVQKLGAGVREIADRLEGIEKRAELINAKLDLLLEERDGKRNAAIAGS